MRKGIIYKVANTNWNTNGILHKFKYVFPNIILFIYIYLFNIITP